MSIMHWYVNYGTNNGKDISDFASEIQQEVLKQFGIKLEPEVWIFKFKHMSSFIIEGGHTLKGSITPQGAKNEALQVICATLLTKKRL